VAEDVAQHVHYGDRISERRGPAVRQVIRAEGAEPLAGGGRGHLIRAGISGGPEALGAVVPLKQDDRRHLGGPKDLADRLEHQPVDALQLFQIGGDFVGVLPLAVEGPALAVEDVGFVRLQDMGEGEDRPAGARQGGQGPEGSPGVVRLPVVTPVEVAQDGRPSYGALQLAGG